MCLAVPAKILSIDGHIARVDYGGSVQREANVSLVKAKKGDYVIVHAGFAIQVLDEKDALETLELFKQILAKE